jgi:hypothetical protein
MRIFTEIASHDTSGVAPGGRIVRTDSSPEAGAETPVNGKWVFTVPEGAALEVDAASYWFPVDANSIPAQTAAEFLIRYPMYDHIIYNFYLDNEDESAFDINAFGTFPDAANTTPAYTDSLQPPSSARCQLGRAGGGDVGMVPNGLAILPKSEARPNNVYGCILTTTIDLWEYNPCYIEVNDPLTLVDGDVVNLAGVPLTARAGAPVADEFQIGGDAATTATNLANAINLGTNSFSGFVSAVVDPSVPNRVQLRPIPSTNTTVTVAAGGGVTGYTIVESHPGTDEVMMWWQSALDTTTEDQGFAGQGAAAGQNSPAIKSHTELPDEISTVLVYASVDDGVNWFRVPYLEPIDLVNAGTELRLCFVNTGDLKVYLHGFCVLFPDLLPPL